MKTGGQGSDGREVVNFTYKPKPLQARVRQAAANQAAAITTDLKVSESEHKREASLAIVR